MTEYPPHIAEARATYIALWRRVLIGWLGWSEERFEHFVSAHDRPGSGFDSPMGTLHEDPLDAIAECLISAQFRRRLQEAGESPFRFAWQLVAQIDPANEVFKRDFDWAAAQRRVVDYLAERGATLPQTDEITEYERRITKKA